MGAQAFSARNTRRLSRRFGIDLDRVLTWGDQSWVEGRTPDDRHVQLDRRSGAVHWLPPEETVHWTSCPKSGQTPVARQVGELPQTPPGTPQRRPETPNPPGRRREPRAVEQLPPGTLRGL